MELIIIFVISVIVISVIIKALINIQRRMSIYRKYGRTDIAEKILNKILWIGETSEQLEDSLGQPVDIDEVVLKTKRKETWKYFQKSATRFGLKITLENDEIVGWDEKL